MAQSGYTPIQLYYSTTAGNTPLAADLANGELAINTNDGVLYYKDSGGVVQVLASGSSVSVLSVLVATTTNLASLSGLLTVDGVTLTAGQRVLVKDQTSSQNNGVYVAAVGAWTRSIDTNSASEIAGRIISVSSGSTNGGEQWATTFKSTDTLGTTAMAWYQVALQNTSVTFTDLTSTGNTTLGDASTDTVTVNGYMGVGGAANIANALTVGSPTLSGTTQRGIDSATTFGTGATASVQQIRAISTLTTAGVYAEWIGLNVPQPQGTGYTLTNAYGLYISDQTKGTNNYGVTSAVTSGTNKWNIYASGTAANYFNGNVGIGTSSPTRKLHVVGSNATAFLADSGTDNTIATFQSSNAQANLDITGSGARFRIGASGTGEFFLSTGTTSTYTERMRIDSSGNVGIGTASPSTKLEVAGSTSLTWTVTASVSGTTMDVTAVTSGTIAVGDLVFGVNIQPYTRITALGTGTGGIGTYTVSVSQTSASGSVSGAAVYANTLIRITDTDTSVNSGQPTGGLQFYTSDVSAPTAGVGAYVAAISELATPDTALIFGTRDNGGGGIDANERMRIISSGNVGIGTSSPAVKLEINSTDAILLPKGTTAEQPTGVAGYLRFNTTTTQFEGYNGTAWSSVGGAAIVNDTTTTTNLYPLFAGATSGTALTIYTGNANLLYKPSTGELTSRVPIAGNGIVVNSQTVATSYTIAAGYSGMSAGPITVASGQSVTVSSGSRWVIQ